MNFSADDIKTLAVFAYNRTLVRHYSSAAVVYRFLTAIDEGNPSWILGAGLCLAHQGAYDEAALWLKLISQQNLAAEQNDLLARLHQQIAFHQQKPAQKDAPH